MQPTVCFVMVFGFSMIMTLNYVVGIYECASLFFWQYALVRAALLCLLFEKLVR